MVWSIVPAGKKNKERVNSRVLDYGVRIPKSESAGFFGLLIAERGSPGKGGCRGFLFPRGTEDDSGDGQGFCGKGVEAPGRRNRGDADLPPAGTQGHDGSGVDGDEPSGGIWQLPNREGQLQTYIPQPEAFGGIPKKDGGKKKNLDLLKRRFHPHPECGKRIEE